MIIPLRDEVYIQPIFDSQTSSGGIYIPDEARNRCDQGVIKLVGPDCKYLQPGDYVLFPGYNGTLMYIEGNAWIIMQEDAVEALFDYDNQNPTIPGLFVKTTDGEYITASYNSIFMLLGASFSEDPRFKGIRDRKTRYQMMQEVKWK